MHSAGQQAFAHQELLRYVIDGAAHHVHLVGHFCHFLGGDVAAQLAQDVICVTAKGRPVKAKTIGQKRYMDSIQKNTVTIGVGPAGTRKAPL